MAIVNKIIHSSVVDGPGNRAAVFLQKCNFKCSYCHNPETRNFCIGCGACVAACKNGSAMLFVSSKVSQLALLPQGRPEAAKRAKAMVMKMEELGFGNCTNTRACEAECPKNESIANIARLNREFIKAKLND